MTIRRSYYLKQIPFSLINWIVMECCHYFLQIFLLQFPSRENEKGKTEKNIISQTEIENNFKRLSKYAARISMSLLPSNPWCGRNVFIYFSVAFMLRFASAKQDQYPLWNVSWASLSVTIDLGRSKKRKRDFFLLKDWLALSFSGL